MPHTSGFIYGLSDPDTGNLRYVGKTVVPKERFAQHLRARSNTYCSRWICKLLADGLKPQLSILEANIPLACLSETEQWWILLCRLAGCKLTNLTAGGGGLVGYKFSDEHKSKIGKAHRGKVISKETKEKLRLAAANRDPEIAKRAGLKRKNPSAAVRFKIGSANRGRVFSQDYRERLSRAHQGRKHSAETIAKMKLARHKRLPSPAQPIKHIPALDSLLHPQNAQLSPQPA